MAHRDHGFAAARDGAPEILGGRAEGKLVGRLGVAAESGRDRLTGFPGAEQGAREDGVDVHALRGELLSERAGGLTSLRGERPQLVRLAGRGVGMAHQIQFHRRGRIVPNSYRYVVCDVFTDRPLAGNQLAVFTDGRELDDETMQALAKEMGFSETVFVLPAEQGGHARIRIFTPVLEVPFAGHPTLGSAFVLGAPLQLPEINLETGSGIVPVKLERQGDRLVFGRMEQPVPTVAEYPEKDELLESLGVLRSDLPVEIYDNGMQHVYVCLGSEDEVAAVAPDLGRLEKLPGNLGVNCFAGSGRNWKTRMFAPAGGVAEDPATGSAAGPLAVHLARHGLISFGAEIEISQGTEIGRPSTLYARAEGTPDNIERVEVGGSAVIVARGEFRLPS